MLDLDVGFMDNPLKLLDLALNDSTVDVLVQVLPFYYILPLHPLPFPPLFSSPYFNAFALIHPNGRKTSPS
jgi:hypothetical protein